MTTSCDGTHDRPIRRRLRRAVLVATVGVLATGAAACGGGDTQGRQDPDLNEVESQVAQLRLEVQTLRQEVQSLRAALPTTSTTTTPVGG